MDSDRTTLGGVSGAPTPPTPAPPTAAQKVPELEIALSRLQGLINQLEDFAQRHSTKVGYIAGNPPPLTNDKAPTAPAPPPGLLNYVNGMNERFANALDICRSASHTLDEIL